MPDHLGDQDDPGTGLELEEPLKFDHASNMPFSAWGTGISFEPKSKFDHSSNEPVLVLGTSIKLDEPLANNHEIDEVVLDQKVTTAGYQGTRQPDQWFGGPALSTRSGNIVLRDADGNVVDGLNYGALVDPYLAEGYQGTSGAREYGCFAPTPGRGGFPWFGGAAANSPNLSAGRYPDGLDEDSNCEDFQMQSSSSILIASTKGTANLKVSSVNEFSLGQKVVVGNGADAEIATVALIGTAGGTSVVTATKVGDTVVPLESVEGFSEGQTITIGSGANSEKAIVASITNRRFRFGRNNNDDGPSIYITVTAPLEYEHSVDEQVAGSGITFAAPLLRYTKVVLILPAMFQHPELQISFNLR